MTSGDDSLPHIYLTLVGLGPPRAELLGAALTRVEPRIRFVVSGRPPAELGWRDVERTSLLAACDGADECGSLLTAARRLRTEEFYWEPIHVCMHAAPADDDEWATFFHPLPPDVRKLAAVLASAQPLSHARRAEVCRAALVSLADEAGALARSLDGANAVEPERVKGSIAAALAELGAHASDDRFDELRRALSGLSSLPELKRPELEAVVPRVVEAESGLRDEGRHERLLATLHRLNNVLRLACYERVDRAAAAARVLSRVDKLLARGLSALPGEQRAEKAATLEKVGALARAALEGDADERVREGLAEQLSKLYERFFTTTTGDA